MLFQHFKYAINCSGKTKSFSKPWNCFLVLPSYLFKQLDVCWINLGSALYLESKQPLFALGHENAPFVVSRQYFSSVNPNLCNTPALIHPLCTVSVIMMTHPYRAPSVPAVSHGDIPPTQPSQSWVQHSVKASPLGLGLAPSDPNSLLCVASSPTHPPRLFLRLWILEGPTRMWQCSVSLQMCHLNITVLYVTWGGHYVSVGSTVASNSHWCWLNPCFCSPHLSTGLLHYWLRTGITGLLACWVTKACIMIEIMNHFVSKTPSLIISLSNIKYKSPPFSPSPTPSLGPGLVIYVWLNELWKRAQRHCACRQCSSLGRLSSFRKKTLSWVCLFLHPKASYWQTHLLWDLWSWGASLPSRLALCVWVPHTGVLMRARGHWRDGRCMCLPESRTSPDITIKCEISGGVVISRGRSQMSEAPHWYISPLLIFVDLFPLPVWVCPAMGWHLILGCFLACASSLWDQLQTHHDPE